MTDVARFTDPDRLAGPIWEVIEPGVPLHMVVTPTIEPGQRSAYLGALREVLPLAQAEPSCLYLHVGNGSTGCPPCSHRWTCRSSSNDRASSVASSWHSPAGSRISPGEARPA
ncbi:hypothetical protein [Pseudonocardia adelaidensis]|uniref:Uncharacterized protein n=1 Tax=Pseudonocardia adelaidensis TaxID=648754 RepID=A0ABP9NE96_9PSEU